LLNPLSLSVLYLLKEKAPITVDQMRVELSMESNNAVTGVLAGIHKNALRAELEPDMIYLRGVTGGGRDATPIYAAGPLLRVEELPPLSFVRSNASRTPDTSSE
jgi:hypothetical protein